MEQNFQEFLKNRSLKVEEVKKEIKSRPFEELVIIFNI
jgi:hypothetical protein